DGIRDKLVTGVQTCALPISEARYTGRDDREDWTWYRPLLAHCVRHGAPGPVLDLGSGLGFFVECCRRWNIDCVGVDASEHAASRSEERRVGKECRCRWAPCV